MVTNQYNATQMIEYTIALMLVILLLSRFGRDAAAWVLKMLYDLFIQHGLMH